MDTFETGLARLEKQLIAMDPETAEKCLAIAKESFAEGDVEDARFWLDQAKWERSRVLPSG